MTVFAGLLLFIGVYAGTWFRVVKQRGTWSVWGANFAGAVAGLIVAAIAVDVFANAFGDPIKGLTGGIVTLMFSAGAWFGVWYWIATRPQIEMAWIRHMLGAACGFLASAVTLVKCIGLFTSL